MRILVTGATGAGAELFVQESFLTYPDSGNRWVTEDLAPRAPRYNRTSLDAESSALQFAGEGGRGVALRFAYIYGPGNDFTDTLAAIVRRGWLPILGRPDGYFSMVTHEDAASAVVATLGAPSGLYNVTDSEPLTRRAIGALLAELLGVPAPRLLPLGQQSLPAAWAKC